MNTSKNQNQEWIPKGWDRNLWLRVEIIAKKMTKEELIHFYEETGAIKADNFNEWSKEELIGILDEIGTEGAQKLIQSQNNK